MPFRDLIDGESHDLKVGWEVIEHGVLGEVLGVKYNDVTWAFPLSLLAKFLLYEYEILERKVIYDLYGPGDRVVEAGAGCGTTGLSILRSGATLAASYEPQVEYMRLAASVYASNGFMDVDVLGAAIASQSGSVYLTIDKVEWDATILDTNLEEKGVEVPCINVNEAITQHRANALHLDVEGAEINIVPAIDFSKINKFSAEIHPSMLGNYQAYDDIIKTTLLKAGFEMVCEAGMARNYPTHNFVVGWKRKEE